MTETPISDEALEAIRKGRALVPYDVELVARTIYKSTEECLAPNFWPGWTLTDFTETDERTRQVHHVMARAVLALLARIDAGEWQTIEGAPKDGTQVLVPGRYGFTVIACWWPAAHYEDGALRGDWDDGERDEDGEFTPFSPSVWAPLPAPPVGSGRSLADATQKPSP